MREAYKQQQQPLKKPKKRKKWPIFLIIFLIIIGGAVAYAARVYYSAKETTEEIYSKAKNQVSMRNVDDLIKNKKPFTILLLGLDTGEEGREDVGRSDTTILATVNPDTQQITMMSIPRDTKTLITGFEEEGYNKINAAYTFGASSSASDGASIAINTVQTLLDIPIDYYASINMKGLEQMVDAVDGVDVEVPFSFAIADATFTKGEQHLNGHQALLYARMRYDDPEGDYGRQKRQQQVITSIIKSAISFKTLLTYESIFNTMSDNVKTNLSFDDMMAIQSKYKSAATTIKKDQLQGYDDDSTGVSYQIIPEDEITRAHDILKAQLE